MGGASLKQEYPAKAQENDCFDINYGKINGRMVLNIIDRGIINCKMTSLRVYNPKVIECIS